MTTRRLGTVMGGRHRFWARGDLILESLQPETREPKS